MSHALETAVTRLRDRPVDVTAKGFGAIAPVTAAELARRRPALFGGDFVLPLLVLRESAVAQNVGQMARYCAAAGVDLAPHGKTTMAPQLFARQIGAGAWAVTAATPGHVQVYRAFGVPRILLANELTDRAGIGWLAAEMAADPGFDCYVYADSAGGVRLLDEVFGARCPRPLPVLVEIGVPGGRTGCRGTAAAIAVADAIGRSGSLRLAGVAGYEGGLGRDGGPAGLAAVAGFCRGLRELGELIRPPGPDEFILSAGGSAFFDVVAATLTAGDPDGYRVVLRSGAYIAHDHGMYATVAPGPGAGPGAAGPDRPELVPALELWAPVLSRPEPDLALLCAGRRDAPFDAGMPVPLRVRHAGGGRSDAREMRVTRLDDQHAYMTVPADAPLEPGDAVCLGISHPCTAFDKWRVIPVTDDDDRVVDAVHTFF